MKTFVITAATGNIGSKLVKELCERGHRVIAVSRDTNKAAPLKALGAEIAVGQMDDSEFLTRTFAGADGVFALIPPEYTAEAFRGRQNVIGDAIARAIKASGVVKVINLSSLGAEFANGVGPIKGLHDQEERLNRLESLDLTHLRAAYFYENAFFGAALVSGQSIFGTAILPDARFSHVATIDIANAAADLLTAPVKTGRRVVEVISEENTTMATITKSLSDAVKKPVTYVAFTYNATKEALVGSGLSADVANEFVEMYDAINNGLIHSNGLAYKSTNPLRFSDFAEQTKVVFGAV
jgi:uncharacterized protein YbjT (DUF2867 family)